MNINNWAKRWNISPEAISELRLSLGILDNYQLPEATPGSEADVLNHIRVEASRKGLRMWRNNVGAIVYEDGGVVRYGLANDSKRVNDSLKSSDLIGIRRVETSAGVVGQFVAREVKKPDWKYTGTKREQAQLNFLTLIASYGGDAAFATTDNTL